MLFLILRYNTIYRPTNGIAALVGIRWHDRRRLYCSVVGADVSRMPPNRQRRRHFRNAHPYSANVYPPPDPTAWWCTFFHPFNYPCLFFFSLSLSLSLCLCLSLCLSFFSSVLFFSAKFHGEYTAVLTFRRTPQRVRWIERERKRERTECNGHRRRSLVCIKRHCIYCIVCNRWNGDRFLQNAR